MKFWEKGEPDKKKLRAFQKCSDLWPLNMFPQGSVDKLEVHAYQEIYETLWVGQWQHFLGEGNKEGQTHFARFWQLLLYGKT